MNTLENRNTDSTGADHTSRQANMSTIEIGSRVRLNDGFAPAFVGQAGTITEGPRTNVFGERLWTVTLDTPTPSADGWTPLNTIAAQAHCYDLER